MRLKDNVIIPNNGEVEVAGLPVGGCRRYDTLECLSDVPYQGRVEKAYWVYTDNTLEDHEVDDIRCEGNECWKFGWQSTMGIYKKGNRYYNVLRLGRRFENATIGSFTCHFEGCPSVSVNIGECEVKINGCVISFKTIYHEDVHIYNVSLYGVVTSLGESFIFQGYLALYYWQYNIYTNYVMNPTGKYLPVQCFHLCHGSIIGSCFLAMLP